MMLVKYGVAVDVYLPAITRGSQDFKLTPTLATNDCLVYKDGATGATITAIPTNSPAGSAQIKVSLTASEVSAKIVTVQLVDVTATKEWEDQEIILQTYGHASASVPFDLSQVTPAVNTVSVGATSQTARDLGASVLVGDKTGFSLAADQAVNVTKIAGAAVSTTVAQIGVNVIQAAGTAWGSGAITANAIANSAITADKINSGAITAEKIADGAIDKATFASDIKTGDNLNVQVKSQDNIDFGALQKASLNAATPAVTVSDKTGFSLSTAGILAIWHQATSAIVTASTIGKKLVDWVLGTDNKVLLSTDAQSGVTIPTVTTVTNPPTGMATLANQTTMINALTTIDTVVDTINSDGAKDATVSKPATAQTITPPATMGTLANQTAMINALTTIDTIVDSIEAVTNRFDFTEGNAVMAQVVGLETSALTSIDNTLSLTHGPGSWDALSSGPVTVMSIQSGALTSIDTVLSGVHGSGSWDATASGPVTVMAIQVDALTSIDNAISGVNLYTFDEGAVWINKNVSETGVDFPKGTTRKPVDNFSDAVSIADTNKLRKIVVSGFGMGFLNVTDQLLDYKKIEYRGSLNNFALQESDDGTQTQVNISGFSIKTAGCTWDKCTFRRCSFDTAFLKLKTSYLEDCLIPVEVRPVKKCYFKNVQFNSSGVVALNYLEASETLEFIGGTGLLTFGSLVGLSNHTININGFEGTITLPAAMIGTVNIRGLKGHLINNATGATVNILDDVRNVTDNLYYPDGTVYCNSSSAYSGITYPKGTAIQPVNSVDDACDIATNNKLSKIEVAYTGIFDGSKGSQKTFIGRKSAAVYELTVVDGTTCEAAIFENLKIGIIGTGKYEQCVFKHCFLNSPVLNGALIIDSHITACAITGSEYLRVLNSTLWSNFDFTPGTDFLAEIRNCAGSFTIKNLTGNDQDVRIDGFNGTITIASSCTKSGKIVINGGSGRIINNGSEAITYNGISIASGTTLNIPAKVNDLSGIDTLITGVTVQAIKNDALTSIDTALAVTHGHGTGAWDATASGPVTVQAIQAGALTSIDSLLSLSHGPGSWDAVSIAGPVTVQAFTAGALQSIDDAIVAGGNVPADIQAIDGNESKATILKNALVNIGIDVIQSDMRGMGGSMDKVVAFGNAILGTPDEYTDGRIKAEVSAIQANALTSIDTKLEPRFTNIQNALTTIDAVVDTINSDGAKEATLEGVEIKINGLSTVPTAINNVQVRVDAISVTADAIKAKTSALPADPTSEAQATANKNAVLLALGSVDTAIGGDVTVIKEQVNLLKKLANNKQEFVKSGDDWYLKVYDDPPNEANEIAIFKVEKYGGGAIDDLTGTGTPSVRNRNLSL